MVARHATAMLILTLIVLALPSVINTCLHSIVSAHNWVSLQLTNVFSKGEVGTWVRRLIADMMIPVLAGAVPAGLYWAIKKKELPYTLHIVWVVWIIQVVANNLNHVATAAVTTGTVS